MFSAYFPAGVVVVCGDCEGPGDLVRDRLTRAPYGFVSTASSALGSSLINDVRTKREGGVWPNVDKSGLRRERFSECRRPKRVAVDGS